MAAAAAAAASSSLSAYWVKFFKGAGFPLDVATKHAVVFSNNRIKPDMLPDLDKPSLKDMGITLMGDMIAILRYAKKVVEETTCERFLVDTEDKRMTLGKSAAVTKKTTTTTTTPTGGSVSDRLKVESKRSTVAREPPAKPKSQVKQIRVASREIAKEEEPAPRKKPKLLLLSTKFNEEEEEAAAEKKKKKKTHERVKEEDEEEEEGEEEEEEQEEEDDIDYTVTIPKATTTTTTTRTKIVRSSQPKSKKMTTMEQKRTVFERLGDSSVTSTTNLAAEPTTTFNITGLGNDVLKRNWSVFNRLGDKDAIRIEKPSSEERKSSLPIATQGILKTRPPPTAAAPTTIATTNIVSTRQTGTMRADHEKTLQKVASSNVKRLVRTTPPTIVQKNPIANKLASERVGKSVPAKARLGLATKSSSVKQVTFDRITKVVRIKKPGVFGRLGI